MYVFCPLFPFEVLKGLKGEVVTCRVWGELSSHVEIALFAESLLSFVASSSFSIRPLKEWVIQDWVRPLDLTSEWPSALEVCIREVTRPQAAE